jgi:hypothetical protein
MVDAGGVTMTPGSPVLAREWIVPAASPDAGAGLVAIANLGNATVTLHVEALVDGRVEPVQGYDGVTLEAGLRTTVDLADAGLPGGALARRALRVRADGPLGVEVTLAPGAPARGVSDLLAIPVRDGLGAVFVDVLSLAAPPSANAPASDPPPGGAVPGPGPDGTEAPTTTSAPRTTSR